MDQRDLCKRKLESLRRMDDDRYHECDNMGWLISLYARTKSIFPAFAFDRIVACNKDVALCDITNYSALWLTDQFESSEVARYTLAKRFDALYDWTKRTDIIFCPINFKEVIIRAYWLAMLLNDNWALLPTYGFKLTRLRHLMKISTGGDTDIDLPGLVLNRIHNDREWVRRSAV